MTNEVASIGVGIETDAIERGIKSLEVLAATGPRVEKAMAGVEGAAAKTGKSLKTIGDGAGKSLDDVGRAAPRAAEGVGRVAKSAEDAKKALSSINASTAGLGQVASAATQSARGMLGFGSSVQASQKSLIDMQAQVRAASTAVAQMSSAMTSALPSMQAAAKAQMDAAKSAVDMGVAFKTAGDQVRAYSAVSARASDASQKTAKSMDATAAAARGLASALAVAGVGFGAQELIAMVDGYTKYTSQLKLATKSTTDHAVAMSSVKRIATDAQQGLGEVGTLYARIANGTAELGLSQGKLANITETVALSLKVSGAAASESSSAMLQLSQAFASGVLRGEEFNSVNEAAPRLMKALADGLNVPVGALRKMAEEGKLTSVVLAEALPKALGQLREEAKSVQTISGAFTVLKNNIMEMVGAQSNASGTTKALASGISGLANNLDLVAAAGAAVAVVVGARLTASVAASGVAFAASAVQAARYQAALAGMAGVSGATATGLVAMGAAARGASAAMAFVGGPIGAVVAVAGLAATAFYAFGNSAGELSKSVGGLNQPLDDLKRKLDALPPEKRIAIVLDIKEEAQKKAKEAASSFDDLAASMVGAFSYAGSSSVESAKKVNELVDQLESAKKTGADMTPILQGAAKAAGVSNATLKTWLDLAANIRAAREAAKTGEAVEAPGAGGGRGGVNPETVAEREKRMAAEREAAAKRLLEISARQNGITKQFSEELDTYAEALRTGAMTATEYAAAVTKANKARYESTEAGKEAAKQSKANDSAAKSEASTYATLIASVRAKIAVYEEEAKTLATVTDGEKLMLSLQAQLNAGAKTMTDARRAEAKAALERLTVLEREKQIRDSDSKNAAAVAKEIDAVWDSAGAYAKKAKELEAANAVYGKGAVAIAEMTLATKKQQLADLQALELSGDRTNALKAEIDEMKRYVDALKGADVKNVNAGTDELVRNAKEMLSLYQSEAELGGVSALERAKIVALRQVELKYAKELDKINKSNLGDDDKEAQRLKVMEAKQIESSAVVSKVISEDWNKTSQLIGDTLSDYIMGGGKNAAQYLKRLFATLVLQPVVNYGVQGAMQSLGLGGSSGSGLSSASGGMPGGGLADWSTWGSKASGWASDASFKLVSNGWQGMGSSMMDLSRTITSVDGYLKDIPGMSGGIGSAAGYVGALYSLSQGKVGAAAGAAIGTYIFPGIGTMIGSMLGGLLDGLDDSGTKHMGAGAIYSKATGVQEGASIYNQATFGMGHRDEHSAPMQEGVSEIAKSLGLTLDAFASAFGKSAGYSVATAFADDSSDDGSWGSLKILDQLGNKLVDWSDNRASKWAPREFADGKEGYEEYLKAVAVDVKAAFLAMDLPEWSDSLLKAATDLDSLNAALQQIAAVKSVFDGLGKTMSIFADLTADAQTRLLAASGGIEALAGNAGSFYEGFYSEGERAQKQRELQMQSLASVGLYIDPFQGKAAQEMFRLTVEEAMRSGQFELAASLMAMSASFKETTDYGQTLLDATATATAAKDAADVAIAGAKEAAATAASWTRLAQVLAMFSGITTDMQAGLLGAAGSMETLTSGAQDFSLGFFSGDERMLRQRETQMAALADMGLYIDPAEGNKAKTLYRKTVEEAMASGQAALVVKLQAMSGAFAETADYAQQFLDNMTEAAKQAAETAAQTAVQSMSGAWSNFGTMAGLAAQYNGNTAGLSQQLGVVQGSYANATTTEGRVGALQQIINLEQGLWNGQQAARQAEAAAATARANAAREQVNAAKQLLSAAQGLGSYAKSLGFSEASGLGDKERLTALDAQRQGLLAKVNTGDVGAMQELQGITNSYLALEQQMAVSQQDYSILSGRIAAELAATAAIQEASASSQVSQYERQIAAAESVASSSAEQFKVSAATQKLIDELLVESATAFETEATLTQKLIDQGAMTATALQSLPAELAGAIGASLIPAIAGLASAISSSAGVSVPQFAAGGFHTGGLRIVGERGPELEATGPSRVWNQSQLAGALGGNNNAALVAAVDRLTAQNALMSAELAEIKASTAKFADQFDQVTAGGNAMATEVFA